PSRDDPVIQHSEPSICHREMESVLGWRQNVGSQPCFPTEPVAVGHRRRPPIPNADPFVQSGVWAVIAGRQECAIRLRRTTPVVIAFPSSRRGGCAERSAGADGWSARPKHFAELTTPARQPGADPPLLFQEGNASIHRKRSHDGSAPATSKTTRE